MLFNREQHVFLNPEQLFVVDRMFGPEEKRKRFLPEDIYEKYHRTSFFKHNWTKLKNKENIKRHGSRIHQFGRYKAALSKHKTKYNWVEVPKYEPPGYVGNVAANHGIYEEEWAPSDKPAPHFERPPIRVNSLMEDKGLMTILRMDRFQERPLPVWSPLLKGYFKRF